MYIVTFSPDRIYRFSPTVSLIVPTSLVATAIGPNEVELSWNDNNTQEGGFKIERKTGMQGIYALIDSVNENVVTYLDQSLEANTLYYYRVFAFLEQLGSEYSNEDSAKTDNPTGVEDSHIPTEYKLEQNYPNPFNPETAIIYQLSKLSFITLKVFDILGGEVATLVYEEKPAGRYEVKINANNLTSGIYFYQLRTASKIITRKMVLMK